MEQKSLRNFPRYNVLHLRPTILFPVIPGLNCYVKDISLGGIQIYSKDTFTLKSFNEIEFKLGKQAPIHLNVNQVWTEEGPVLDKEHLTILKDDFDQISFRTGLRLKFYDKNSYHQWHQLLFALHNIQNKKK